MNGFIDWSNLFGQCGAGFGWWLILPLLVWSFIWKGLALWKAARSGSRPWFVALLVINTLGILEILYLYVFSKKSESTEKK